MTAIGNYLQPAGGGMTVRVPYYDERKAFLPAAGRVMTQILIDYMGSLVWINVNPEWLEQSAPNGPSRDELIDLYNDNSMCQD